MREASRNMFGYLIKSNAQSAKGEVHDLGSGSLGLIRIKEGKQQQEEQQEEGRSEALKGRQEKQKSHQRGKAKEKAQEG